MLTPHGEKEMNVQVEIGDSLEIALSIVEGALLRNCR